MVGNDPFPKRSVWPLRVKRLKWSRVARGMLVFNLLPMLFPSGKRKKNRGLFAVLGDTGGGKRAAVRLWMEKWSGSEHEIVRCSFAERLDNRDSLYRWFHETFQLPAQPTSAEECVAMIDASVGDGIYILEKAERSFLRTVGGFDAFRELLYVLNATSHSRVWALVMHLPAWNYLARVGDLVNLSVFRNVREIEGFDDKSLREICISRVKAMGYRIDFTDIVRRNVLGSDAGVELERSISVFFSLLREVSEGNPQVALSLWANSLSLGEDRQVRVRMGQSLSIRPIDGLTESEMFVLVASNAIRYDRGRNRSRNEYVTDANPRNGETFVVARGARTHGIRCAC